MNHLIFKIRKIVKTACYQPTNKSGYGAWDHHIKIVEKYAIKLAKIYKADLEIVELSSLLHDYASVVDSKFDKNHEIIGAKLAKDILKKYDYPQEKIEIIEKCILNHRGSKPQNKTSLEEMCVTNADAMAHITQVGSLFYLCFNKHNLNIKQSEKWIWQKLQRSWAKLTPEAQKIIKTNYQSAKIVLNQK